MRDLFDQRASLSATGEPSTNTIRYKFGKESEAETNANA
jgi:hypothetical protein